MRDTTHESSWLPGVAATAPTHRVVNRNEQCRKYGCAMSHDSKNEQIAESCCNSDANVTHIVRDTTHESSRSPGVATTAPTHRVINRNEQCREYGCAISHDSKTEHIAMSCCNSDARVTHRVRGTTHESSILPGVAATVPWPWTPLASKCCIPESCHTYGWVMSHK